MRHGKEDANLILEAIPWRDKESDKQTNRVIDIEALAFGRGREGTNGEMPGIADLLATNGILAKADDLTSADFALQMIEGVQRVRFQLRQNGSSSTSLLSFVGYSGF